MSGLWADDQPRKDCEAFDPVKRTWEPLPEMDEERGNAVAAPVAGGMVVASDDTVTLFDEESGRWLALAHPMAQPRDAMQLVPASALQAS